MPRTSPRFQATAATISAPPLSPSLASSLPVEIIALILSFYYACIDWQDTDLYRDPKKDETPSLVCRSWRLPAQRILLKDLHVHEVEDVVSLTTLLSSSATAPGQFVRTLHLPLCDYEEKTLVKQQDANRLLVLLPNLSDLRLLLPQKGQYSKFLPLPNLRRLLLDSYGFDKNLTIHRQILSATPNIIFLGLSNQKTNDIPPPPYNTKKRPITLPSLAHVSLQSNQFFKALHKLNLLSEPTLDQIDHLQIDMREGVNDGHSPLALLDKIGENIKTLTLGKTDSCSESALLAACPNVEMLVTTEDSRIDAFPRSLRKIICKTDMTLELDWLWRELSEWSGLTQEKKDWDHIDYVEVQVRSVRGRLEFWRKNEWNRVKKRFDEMNVNVHLVIDGIPQKPDIQSYKAFVLHNDFYSFDEYVPSYYTFY